MKCLKLDAIHKYNIKVIESIDQVIKIKKENDNYR